MLDDIANGEVAGIPLNDVSNRELQMMVRKLWAIIEDIDIASNMDEVSDDTLRGIVNMTHSKRWNTGLNANGTDLYFDEDTKKL